ncbi:unnamed protein product [Caenorhabditis sp. 36 PRJEB53466]|nr:unnamed protein product [Caenorhabditis sp. 36 PRJEB53466]
MILRLYDFQNCDPIVFCAFRAARLASTMKWLEKLRRKTVSAFGDESNVADKVTPKMRRSLCLMFKFAKSSDVTFIITALICALLGGTIQPTVLLIGGWITDLYLTNGTTVGDDEFLHSVLSLIYAGLGFGVIILVLALIQGICIQRGTRRILDNLRKEFLGAVLRQDANWLDKNSSGSITCQLNENVEVISDGLGNKCCMLVRGFAMFTSSIIACAFINWQLTFITFTMGPVSAFVLHLLTKVNETTNEELMSLSAQSHSIIEESVLNVRTVQACNGQQFMINKFKRVNESIKKYYNKSTFWAGFFDGLALFVIYFITGISLFFGCRLYFDGEIKKAGDVILVVNTVCVTGYFLGLLGPHMSSLQRAATSFQLLHDVIKSAPKSEGKEGETKVTATSGHIEFRNVRFKYSSRDKDVLQGLSFEVLPGQTVALVGTSGCGKSTSIGLLTKLYRATEGEILIDGQNIDMLDARTLRQQIGIVQQEPKLFDGTIVDNIRLGRQVDDETVQSATDIANASDFIENRALVTSPSILLLDEATSALDAHNEHIVNKALNKASVGRTTIIIAHRLSSLKNVDRIYVLDQGKTKEIGTHDQLIELGGIYAKLAKSQEIEQSSKKDWEREELRRAEKMKKKSRNVENYEPNSTILQEHEHNLVGSVIAENHESISFTGIAKLMHYLPKHPKMLTLIIVLSIPRAIELCSYGLGMSFAFNTLQRSKDDYMTWNWITLGEQTLAGLTFWVLQALLMYLCGWIANDVMNEVKESMLKEVLHKPIPYFDNPETSPSACVSRIVSHAHNCYACLDHRAIRFVWFVAGTIFSLLLAFPFVWELGMLGLGITILLTLFSMHFVSVAHKAHSDKSAQDRSGEFAVEVVEQIRAIKLLAVEGYFEKRFAEYLSTAEVYENKIGFLSSLNFAVTQSYVFACDMLLFYVGTLLIYHGRYTPDKIFLAFNGAQMSAWGVMYFSPWFPEIIRGSASANQIFSFFDNKCHVSGDAKPDINGSVHVEDVKFAYPSTPHRNVCEGLSIEAPKGNSIALVGASGCGKSTIIAMLERFYETKSGKIEIDGKSIEDIEVNHLRQNISVVGQEPILFNATIQENITIGMENVPLSEVQNACKVANAASFIENFPMGYETIVGEGGGSLSGGQKQRIAIARAIIRKPKILLLDEATSALDAQSEEIVQKALRSATEGRTSIIVAHRLSTVQHCNMIYYISRGAVAESLIEKQEKRNLKMADDNVSFTDAGDQTGAQNKGGNSSAMLDLLGSLNKKDDKPGKKGKKEKKSGKKEKKGKTKKVRKADKYESQNFLFRIEGTIFCAGIIIGIIVVIVFVVAAIVFGVMTNGNLVSYMQPLWGSTDENTDDSGTA